MKIQAMQRKVKYFAYGSNLHPDRLRARVPSAQLLQTYSLSSYKLSFQKMGVDGSGKCHIMQTGNVNDNVFGAIYELDIHEKPLLDRCESLGTGYFLKLMHFADTEHDDWFFTYVGNEALLDEKLLPFDWYKHLVHKGAEFLNLPDWYLKEIEQQQHIEDVDEERRANSYKIIVK
jgi:hypothetical protein